MTEEDKPKAQLNIEKLFEDMKKFGVTEFRMGDLEIKMQQESRLSYDYQAPDYSRGFDK